jgi:hypothetical protein
MTARRQANEARGFVRDNALSVAFLALLIFALVGQAISGVAAFNGQQLADGDQQYSLWQYVRSSSFAVDVAENWQSEYQQFALYIVATTWLIQRGSSESKKLGDVGLAQRWRRRSAWMLAPAGTPGEQKHQIAGWPAGRAI